MPLKTIRPIAMIGLPLLLVIAALTQWSTNQNSNPSALFEAFYVVSLTANIGYFTNYVAIKMLFRPHHKTAFGRQGLIPKNQDKLADTLAQTLIENFLSKQQWQEYLEHTDLVNKVLREARVSSANWLNEPNNIERIVQQTSSFLRENDAAINQSINQLQQRLITQLSSKIDINELLNQGFAWLEDQFEKDPQKMQSMIEPIIKTIAENIPDIANELVRALDNHIEEQDTFKRGIAKMARWSADFSEDDIKRYLFRMVASFEFRQTLFNGLQSLLNEYKNKSFIDGILSDELSLGTTTNEQQRFSVNNVLSMLADKHLANINWVNLFIENVLTEPSLNPNTETVNCALKPFENSNISTICHSVHNAVFRRVEAELADGPLHQWIIDELISMIEKLDLREMVKRKAAAFSPQKMENVFQTMISEQLVFIELLGAVLGALSGLALVDIRLFAALAGLLASVYISDLWLTRIKQQSNSIN